MLKYNQNILKSKSNSHNKVAHIKSPSIKRNLTPKIVSLLDPPTTDTELRQRLRVLEIGSGRAAAVGLITGNINSLFLHKSFLTQAQDEFPFIIGFYLILLLITYLQFDGKIEKLAVKYELKGDRISMIFMTILLSIEYFNLL
jgi:hypothetical protein